MAEQLELDFDKAFETHSKDEPPAPEPVQAEAEEIAPEAEEIAPEAEESGDPAEAPAEDEPEDEPAPEPEPPKAKADTQESHDDLLERLARLVKEDPKAKQSEPKQAEPEPQPDILSEEDKQFLAEYEKDWPDVARAESLRRRAEYRDLLQYVFNEIATNLRPTLETVQALSQQAQYSQITAAVEDYDVVRDKVIDWASSQPPYLQAAYQHVIDHGTAEEVADLIRRYKADTGAAAAPAPAPAKKETELPPATKQAVASLAPVSSKRSTVNSGLDPNDFESAFAQFASKFG